MKLFQLLPFPPGGFPFSQIWLGKQYDFPDVGLDIQNQAAIIVKFRKANGIPRATLNETLDDLSQFTCQRLGNDPRFCSEDGNGVVKFQKTTTGGCRGCGAKLT